jgi:hypothetical protein
VTAVTPGQECDKCGLEYIFDTGNAVVYWFENAPWFSYCQSLCPRCGGMAITFMRDAYQECMEFFIKGDFGFITESEPPEAAVEAFERIYEVHTEAEVELTARMELELQNLHVILENIPDDLLLDMFETPEPKHEMPERWC